MPIGRGIMQANRFNIYPTQTSFLTVSPTSPQPCGATINFTATVVNTKINTRPTGTVSLIDETGTIVATSTLTPAIATNTSNSPPMSITITAGNHSYHLIYNGVVNQFAPSQSVEFLYSGNLVGTTFSFPDLSGASNFCPSQDFVIQLVVTPSAGIGLPTGNVDFRLYSDNVTSFLIGSAALIPGITTSLTSILLPAFFTDRFVSSTGTFYIQALYGSDGCFNTNSSPAGIQTVSDIITVNNITTTTAITPGTTTFCIHRDKTFSGTVSRSITTLQPFNIGTVTLTATKVLTTIILGTTPLLSGGLWSLLVPSDTFPSTGSWFVTANYNSDGYCYLDSTSTAVNYIGNELSTTPTVTFTAGPHTFNNDITAVFTAHVGAGGFNADNGNVHFRSYNNSNVLQLDLGTAPVDGVGNATIIIPPGTFGASSQYLTATYEHSSMTPGCFSDNVSAHYVTTITEVI